MAEKAQAVQRAEEHNMPVIESLPGGGIRELQRILPDGTPMYYETKNIEAAKTVSTNKVWPGGDAGLSLDGEGMTIGEWDAGGVLLNHEEFKDSGGQSRVTQKDTPSISTDDHATHVAGTLAAEGKDPKAKGMAYKAQLHAYDWNNDYAEMTSFTSSDTGNHLIPNHSYGPDPKESGIKITGWYDDSCKSADQIVNQDS